MLYVSYFLEVLLIRILITLITVERTEEKNDMAKDINTSA